MEERPSKSKKSYDTSTSATNKSNNISMSKSSNDTSMNSQRTPLSVRQQSKLIASMSYVSPDKNTSVKSSGIKRNRKGETPLHIAAIKNDCAKINKIIGDYESVDIIDYAGWTPLLEAANKGNFDAVTLLIKNGANINFKGPNGITPLHDACYNYQIDVIKYLILHGADLNVEDDDNVSCYKHIINDTKLWNNLSELPEFMNIFQSYSAAAADIISIDSFSVSPRLNHHYPPVKIERKSASSITSVSSNYYLDNKENMALSDNEDINLVNNLNSTLLSNVDVSISQNIPAIEVKGRQLLSNGEEGLGLGLEERHQQLQHKNELFEPKAELNASCFESYFSSNKDCLEIIQCYLTRTMISNELYCVLATLFNDELSNKLCSKFTMYNEKSMCFNTLQLKSAIINFRDIFINEILEFAPIFRILTQQAIILHLNQIVTQGLIEFKQRFNSAIEHANWKSI